MCVQSGKLLNDNMLSLMVLRYGASSGHMSLENFISLMLRLDRMQGESKSDCERPSFTLVSLMTTFVDRQKSSRKFPMDSRCISVSQR